MARYVALLRGINVGGKNMIKMADLKAAFEDQGLQNVTTYIASGNVLFESPERSAAELTQRIEDLLSAAFNYYQASVVLRTRAQMRSIVDQAPKGFGSQPRRYLSDVVFLKSSLRAAAVLKNLPMREGVDQAHAGPGVLYLQRLASRATQSRLNRIAAMPTYRNMTLRSWSTAVKLQELMDAS